MKKDIGKVFRILVLIGVVGFGLIQLVPYGKNHKNPPVVSEPQWDNPQTRELTKRACFGCHSNETVRPWYGSVAPVSWLLQFDIDEARSKVNFSDWEVQGLTDANYLAQTILEGEMPPFLYVIMHSEAKLTDAEKQQLVDGFMNTKK